MPMNAAGGYGLDYNFEGVARNRVQSGMVEPPTLDVSDRVGWANLDGTKSSILTISIGIGPGMEALIPTIAPDGQRLTEDQAVDRFFQTGEHLGIFATPDSATIYARDLSSRQGMHAPSGVMGAINR